MERKEQLEQLMLVLEQAVDQLGRAQRTTCAGDHGVADLEPRIDAAYAQVAALRNQVRDALMVHLATRPPGPRKLPLA